MTIVIDSSYLVALILARDSRHNDAMRLGRQIITEMKIVPAPVVTEVFYLALSRSTHDIAAASVSLIRKAYIYHCCTAR